MSRLIAFGCSNTFGLSLDGTKITDSPAKRAWPALVGAINYGVCGASNKEIMLNILEKNFKPKDIVIVLWTYTKTRTLIFTEKKIDTHLKHHNKGNQGYQLLIHKHKMFHEYMDSQTKQAAEAWYKWNVMRSQIDAMIDEYTYIKTANLHLQQHNIKVINLHCDDSYDQYKSPGKIPTNLYTKLHNVENLLVKNDRADDGLHPGPNAHKLLSEFVWKQIKLL